MDFLEFLPDLDQISECKLVWTHHMVCVCFQRVDFFKFSVFRRVQIKVIVANIRTSDLLWENKEWEQRDTTPGHYWNKGHTVGFSLVFIRLYVTKQKTLNHDKKRRTARPAQDFLTKDWESTGYQNGLFHELLVS